MQLSSNVRHTEENLGELRSGLLRAGEAETAGRRFARPAPRLLVLREHWDRPVHGADPALFSVLEDHAERLLAELPAPEPPLVSRLRAVLREELRGGDVGVEHVARRLALGARTLQRRLEDEGVRFAEVLAELRTELARDYLREPGLSIAEIAWLLGFSEQSAFTRAFKRWVGTTPATYRKDISHR